MTSFAAKSFSAKNVSDLIITNLIDSPLVERARKRKTVGLEGMDTLQDKDAKLAGEAMKKQTEDFSTALLNLKPVIDMMNAYSRSVAGATDTFNNGSTADKAGMLAGGGILGGAATYGGLMTAKGLYQWFTGGTAALNASAAALDGSAAALTAAAYRIAGGSTVANAMSGGGAAATAGGSIWSKIGTGLGAAAPFGVPALVGAGAYYAAESANQAQGLTQEVDRDRLRKQSAKYNWWGKYTGGDEGGIAGPEVSDTTRWGTGVDGDKGPVSVTVSGGVTGEATITVKVEAGSTLLQAVEQAHTALKLAGQINSNGPGSTGKSSPNAAAPSPKGNTGASGVW